MRRFILKEQADTEGRFIISGKDFRYLSKVLRLKEGHLLRVLLSSGEEGLLRIEKIKTRELEGRLEEKKDTVHQRSEIKDSERKKQLKETAPLYLCQALPKGKKMDLIVRQAAELGIKAVLPFCSEHSIPRIQDADAAAQRQQRWESIVREARQQSGSDTDTIIHTPTDFQGILTFWDELKNEGVSAVGLLLHQDPLEKGTFHGYLNGSPDAVVLAVGPEGGFSDQEAALLVKNGFKPLLLGINVLRTETAALAAAAAVHVLLLEKESWIPSKGLPV